MRNLSIILLSALLANCGGGSSKDPETNDLGEFNPPGQLASLTRESALELTWVGANAEDDFQGYHVFGTTTSLADLQKKVTYPKNASILNAQSIPRCKDNNAFFNEFGFPDTDAECESSVIPEASEEAAPLAAGNMGFLIQDDEESADESEEESLTIDFNVPCTGEGQTVEDGSVSLAPQSEGSTLGRVFCLVDKAYVTDKLATIKNGTTYSYMAVAVKGSDKNEISWISNVISDTPTQWLYNAELELNGGDESDAQYAVFSINGDDPSALDAPTPQSCSTTSDLCKLTKAPTGDDEGIMIARDADTSGFGFQQRLLVFSKSGGKFSLQQRGAQVFYDPRTESYLPQLPGDEAISDSDLYENAGTKFAFYEHAVFDFQYALDDGTFRYGKIVITDLSYADDEAKSSKSTLDVTVVIQPQVDQTHYLTGSR